MASARILHGCWQLRRLVAWLSQYEAEVESGVARNLGGISLTARMKIGATGSSGADFVGSALDLIFRSRGDKRGGADFVGLKHVAPGSARPGRLDWAQSMLGRARPGCLRTLFFLPAAMRAVEPTLWGSTSGAGSPPLAPDLACRSCREKRDGADFAKRLGPGSPAGPDLVLPSRLNKRRPGAWSGQLKPHCGRPPPRLRARPSHPPWRAANRASP